MTLRDKLRHGGRWLKAGISGRRVVYTCLFGHSEPFLDLKYEVDGRTDFYCFTDDETLHSDFWKIVKVPRSLLDPSRRSKEFKHRPHAYFPGHHCSLYLDNTVQLVCPPELIFKKMKRDGAGLMMFSHPERNCVYEEARLVSDLCLDDQDTIDAQMRYYRKLKYPENNGLHAATIMLRRHNDPEIIRAMNEWHDQVLRYSKRDQLSFDVVRHFVGLRVDTFKGSLVKNRMLKWPVLQDGRRLPRDFDDEEYLRLNPDLLESDMSARKHYLEFGIMEGRRYR